MGRMRPVLAVSDVHLGRATRERSAAFRAFLSYAREAASGLLLAGDIFDFYFEWRSVVMAEHVRVLAALADVVEAGVPVWFLGGNHDSWVGPVLCRDVGLRCLPEPARLVLAGRRCLAVHGKPTSRQRTGAIGFCGGCCGIPGRPRATGGSTRTWA